MIKFFRKIRYELMEKNKTGKYLKYAIGEIVLVVIGILIALQINTWNNKRIEKIKEQAVLTEISNSINSDLKFFENILDYRLNIKSEGISGLMKLIGEKEHIASDSIMQLFEKAGFDISINYDSGTYDALKSYGFDIISNDRLRKSIINRYEVSFPALKEFGNKTPKLLNPFIEKLKIELFKKEPIQNKKGVWNNLNDIPKNDEILKNQKFLNIIDFENKKYYNYLSPLNSIRNGMIKLDNSIIKELEYLENK